MALSVIQASSETTVATSSSGAVALTSVVSGSGLVIPICQSSTTPRIYSVTNDTVNGTGSWAAAFHQGTGRVVAQLYLPLSASGSPNVTVSVDTSTASWRMQMFEIGTAGGGISLQTFSSNTEGVTASHVASASSTLIDTTTATVIFANYVASANFNGASGFGSYTQIMTGAGANAAFYQVFASSVTDERCPFTSTTARPTEAGIAAYAEVSAGSGLFGKLAGARPSMAGQCGLAG